MSSTDKGLLTPENCAAVFIDHQPCILAGLAPDDRKHVLDALEVLIETARIFELPVIVTAVTGPGLDGRALPRLLDAFPNPALVARTSMNAWDDPGFVAAVGRSGRRNLVMAALLSEACLVFPALQMLDEGYGVYAVEDASRGTSRGAHRMGLRRIAQAGGVSITALQFVLELQRDWGNARHRDDVAALLATHYGPLGSAGAGRPAPRHAEAHAPPSRPTLGG